jgi:hypothetical protein
MVTREESDRADDIVAAIEEARAYRNAADIVKATFVEPGHWGTAVQKRMEQTGHWDSSRKLYLEALKERLRERFATVDFEQAKADVRPFIRDGDELALWSNRFFGTLVERVTAAD